MHGSPNPLQLAAVCLLALASAVLPSFVGNAYVWFLVNLILTNIVLALGLELLIGRSGQFAFAHVAFFAVGAYGTAILQMKAGLPFVPSFVLSALSAGAIGMLIGVPATRMRSINLALATFAFAQGVTWLLGYWEGLTGGPAGMTVSAARLFGHEILNDDQATPWMGLIASGALASVMYLATSKLGRDFEAIKESEHAATVSGVHVHRTKVIAFALSGLYAGMAGGMLVLHRSFLVPDEFGFTTLVLVISMLVVGGLGSIGGVIIGVIIITMLPQALQMGMREILVWQELVYGCLLILFMMFMPRGVWGALHKAFARKGGA